MNPLTPDDINRIVNLKPGPIQFVPAIESFSTEDLIRELNRRLDATAEQGCRSRLERERHMQDACEGLTRIAQKWPDTGPTGHEAPGT